MTTWFTADQHFGHTRIIEYVKRPFSSVDEMDDALINSWNERVREEDLVYHLGDFTLSNYKGFEYYLNKLNGTIFFVPGGHDQRWLSSYKKNGSDSKFTVLESLIVINVRNVDLVLCHYPLLTWERGHYGVIHLHGHSHGNVGCIGRSNEGSAGVIPGYRVDVGVDCNNFYPVSITDILNRIDAYEGVVKV
jgi:calcineurin-like phosphoesterase family protein